MSNQTNIKREPDPIDLYVGQRLKLRRSLAGISQRKLAGILDITFQQIQKYEKGSNRIGSSRLYTIAQNLGVPVSYFFEDMPNNLVSSELKGIANVENMPKQDLLERKETLNLVRNYYDIKDDSIRKNVYNLIKSLV